MLWFDVVRHVFLFEKLIKNASSQIHPVRGAEDVYNNGHNGF